MSLYVYMNLFAMFRINKKVVITPKPTCELQWTDDLFEDTFIGDGK